MSTHRSTMNARVCSFTFADGRRCRAPRRKVHAHLSLLIGIKTNDLNSL
jgi:hypothetical protein